MKTQQTKKLAAVVGVFILFGGIAAVLMVNFIQQISKSAVDKPVRADAGRWMVAQNNVTDDVVTPSPTFAANTPTETPVMPSAIPATETALLTQTAELTATFTLEPTAVPDTPVPTFTPQPTEVIEVPTPTEVLLPEVTEEAGEAFEEIDFRSDEVAAAEAYISNPGMGWQYQGGTFPVTSPSETVAYGRRSDMSWMILNPADGVYDWGPLDAQLNTAVSQGKQFSFRVYTMIGSGWGDAQVPQWVLDKGAVLLPSGEPNYSNCTYQQEWGKFVNALIARYDGNPDIAFIDISGYGEFNEWSWNDQTDWDYVWADAYTNGTAGPETMSLMDSYARRVLADIFVGGSFEGHQCVDANNSVQTYDYNYQGFSDTQLVLPYAGIAQSTQYVFTKTQNVGFRFDCMGRSGDDILGHVGNELDVIYQHAPVVYEICQVGGFSASEAMFLIENTHPTLIHDANHLFDGEAILPFLEPLGYEYSLNYLRYDTRVTAGETMGVVMEWQNDGIAPYYPQMGQDLQIHLYLVNETGQRAADMTLSEEISAWLPSSTYGGSPPVYTVEANPVVPGDVLAGIYSLEVGIVDERTGEAVWLPDVVLIETKIAGIIVSE